MSYDNNIIKKSICQADSRKIITVDGKNYLIDSETGETFELLSDKSSVGKERPWKEHKAENEQVEKVYRLLADKSEIERDYWSSKAERLHGCGCHLWFNLYLDRNGGTMKKLKSAESCRVRLCPLCSWLRSRKIQAHMRKILEAMYQTQEYDFLLVTLTVPNCQGSELSDTITDILSAFNRFVGYSAFNNAVVGWYRGLEVTHNVARYKFKWARRKGKKVRVYLRDEDGQFILNTSFDTYHPHIHLVVAVKKSYFKHNDYISHDKWLEMWRKATKNPNITQVDVRKVRPKAKDLSTSTSFSDMIISAVLEVSKYTVKSEDYVNPTDWDMSCKSVEVLDPALHKRRLVAFGGIMKELHEKLNLDDEIDGDLIEDGETPNGDPVGKVCAVWHTGYQQYFMNDELADGLSSSE